MVLFYFAGGPGGDRLGGLTAIALVELFDGVDILVG
jgi:hypothetical protein